MKGIPLCGVSSNHTAFCLPVWHAANSKHGGHLMPVLLILPGHPMYLGLDLKKEENNNHLLGMDDRRGRNKQPLASQACILSSPVHDARGASAAHAFPFPFLPFMCWHLPLLLFLCGRNSMVFSSTAAASYRRIARLYAGSRTL